MDEQVQKSVDVTEEVGPKAFFASSTPDRADDATPADAALAVEWIDKIKDAESRCKKAFDRMRYCQRLAKDGAPKEWANTGKYVVPILNRHINQAVASLYAKNPKAYVSRKRKLMYQVWDGKRESLAAALPAAQMGDPMAMSMVEEVAQVAEYNAMLDKLSETLVLCWEYFTSEQAFGFKAQLKAAVRRAKVCGVAYVKLAFQRVLKPNPEITAQISDVTSKIAAIKRRMEEAQEGELPEDSAEYAQLQHSLMDLQAQEVLLVREGPVFDFPRADEIIIDPNCRHLKSLAGAGWIAHRYDKTFEEIEEIWGVDVEGKAKTYKENDKKGGGKGACTARVYEVWNRREQQMFVVCEGYNGFLRAPSEPDVKIERFFTVFPLVFNETESDDDLYPPSDVWQARHIQEEYNRSREGLREHRIANRPWYAATRGALEEADKQRVAEHDAHEVVELNALQPGQSVDQILQRGPSVPIDPNQYEVEMHFTDLLRTVGSSDEGMGVAGDGTATASAIAESSRSAALADNVDDLDELLTNLAQATGQLMLSELSKEVVTEIAGPGSVWPTTPFARDEVAKDLLLDIRAGSSGRPNKAAELANLERAMPFITMLPGVNPEPFAKAYMTLLDIDLEDATVKGLPSITALNAMMARPPAPAAGPEAGVGGRPEAQTANGADPQSDPAQQGPAGMGAPTPAQTSGSAPGISVIQYDEKGNRR